MSKQNDNCEKTIKLLCDDARGHIAELLPLLVDKIGALALGQNSNEKPLDVSLPHAKFIVDLADSLGLWKYDDKKLKSAEEAALASPASAGEADFSENVIKKLDEVIGRSPNTTALP